MAYVYADFNHETVYSATSTERSPALPSDRAAERGVTPQTDLISAPAGFGKTTLVSTWIAGCGRPAAWLSLDDQDSDPTRFLTYLVAALRTIAPTLGEGLFSVLQSPQPPPPEAVLTALLNEITNIPESFVLVLDDYHVLDARPIDQALAFLLDHLPLQLHLAIATREDPPLPLARLRARGHMTELRATDLRFTRTEAATFLTEVMSLSFSASDIAALEGAPKAGLPVSSWRRSRCEGERTFLGSLGRSSRRQPLRGGLSGRRGSPASAGTDP